ncbi:hypothetical protein [Methanobacterium sp. ACI-7]|uniref:hypothetical protein n=1 Tax=unclassified Methanobacterium TaxID=2627676 RepID=UPI0039C00EE1
MDKRGIITVDLIFATLVILLVSGGLLTVVSERMDGVSNTEKLGNARMTAESVAESINKVYSGGNGHQITLNLPDKISNSTYEIKVNSSGVFVLIDGMIGKSYINPKKITSDYRLDEQNVLMYGNRNYVIKNVQDIDGNNWIVIKEL